MDLPAEVGAEEVVEAGAAEEGAVGSHGCSRRMPSALRQLSGSPPQSVRMLHECHRGSQPEDCRAGFGLHPKPLFGFHMPCPCLSVT